MDSRKLFGVTAVLIAALIVSLIVGFLIIVRDIKRDHGVPLSMKMLGETLGQLEQKHPGQIGVYVKNIGTGEVFGHHADQIWYVASGIKLPVALEVLRQIEQGRVDLDHTIRLKDGDFVDGAGETNYQPVGSELSIRYLFEQMLIHSDNTASDLLIELVGLERVNALVRELVPQNFGPITTLSEVRRQLYSRFHEKGGSLGNPHFLKLRSIRREKKRIRELASLLELRPDELRYANLDDAYEDYYATGLNSATLRAYGTLLEKVIRGQAVGPQSTEYLLGVMSRVETGKRRIVAGLPKQVRFAHKTGTQHARACDFGYAWNEAHRRGSEGLIIAICTRGFRRTWEAEKQFREIAQAITRSDLL